MFVMMEAFLLNRQHCLKKQHISVCTLCTHLLTHTCTLCCSPHLLIHSDTHVLHVTHLTCSLTHVHVPSMPRISPVYTLMYSMLYISPHLCYVNTLMYLMLYILPVHWLDLGTQAWRCHSFFPVFAEVLCSHPISGKFKCKFFGWFSMVNDKA